jgi:hypothetical protein
MNELLALVLRAYGGLDQWQRWKTVSAHVITGGALWPLKGQASLISTARVTVDLHHQWTSHAPFTTLNYRTSFTPDRVAIETTEGVVVEELLQPRASFQGHTAATPWAPLHVAYFAGYAMWTYLTSPFAFVQPGFAVAELAPWQEGGETFRRLQVTFPAHIATHCPVQVFYIDERGFIRRHDYDTEVLGGAPAAHYSFGHTEVAGLIVPTKRLVYGRRPDLSPIRETVLVSMEISGITYY